MSMALTDKHASQMNYRELSYIIAAGMVGTVTMTLYSYAASWASRDNFKEPVLLGKLLQRTLLPVRSPFALPAGWAAHFAIGCTLAYVFYRNWKLAHSKPNMLRALAYRWCSGVAAVLWWHTAFRLHPRPPRLARRNFYLHLLVAHLVYSISVARTCLPILNRAIQTHRHEKK